MTARRFDTEALLVQLLGGEGDAFLAIYERYRGRVYRFIVRQCGNGEQGKQAYISAWAHLIDSRLKCDSSKALKCAFFKNLICRSLDTQAKTPHSIPRTYLPRRLEEEGNWSTLLVEHLRKLPDGLAKRFLFRHEIGLSCKAVASIFTENSATTQVYLDQAERKLMEGLARAGYRKSLSMDLLYRETRIIKPPASWDELIIESYPVWIQLGVPVELLKIGQEGEDRSMKGILRKTLDNLKSDFTHKFPHSHFSASRF